MNKQLLGIMSVTQDQIEPKNFFLNQLITLFFQTSIDLIQHQQPVQGRIDMRALMATIPADTEEAKNIRNKIDTEGYSTLQKLIEIFENEITPFMHRRYFSELQLGIIQTSTLAGDSKKPENEPASPLQTSRL